MPSKDVNPISDAIKIVVDEYRTLVKKHPSKPPVPLSVEGGGEGLRAVMERFGVRPNRNFPE